MTAAELAALRARMESGLACRSDVFALLAEVERQRALLSRWESFLAGGDDLDSHAGAANVVVRCRHLLE